LSLNVYAGVRNFIADMDQVFENCRLYNGVESHVGQMGIRIKNEYLNYLKTYKLVERFEEDKPENRFVIDESTFDIRNTNEPDQEEISESELPKDSVHQMNERNNTEHMKTINNPSSVHNVVKNDN
jgi:hypothetical protein